MRPCSSALAAFLNNPASREALVADLYTIDLVGGPALRYSGWTTELSVPATSFPAGSLNAGAAQTFILGPRFGRSKVTTKIGIDPTELDIDILAGPDDKIGTLSFADAVRVGLFDGATVELDRLFAPGGPGTTSYGSPNIDTTSLGALVWFYGKVAEADIGRSKVTLKVKSLLNLIAATQFPRRLYGSNCTHIFGGQMCGYDRVNGINGAGQSGFPAQNAIAAATGSTQGLIVTNTYSPNPVPAAYAEGTITGATGANAGLSRTIPGVAGNLIYLYHPFVYPVVAGDTFTLLPGCPHTATYCDGTLNNLARYGGFPHIPPPEAAV